MKEQREKLSPRAITDGWLEEMNVTLTTQRKRITQLKLDAVFGVGLRFTNRLALWQEKAGQLQACENKKVHVQSYTIIIIMMMMILMLMLSCTKASSPYRYPHPIYIYIYIYIYIRVYSWSVGAPKNFSSFGTVNKRMLHRCSRTRIEKTLRISAASGKFSDIQKRAKLCLIG